MQLISSMEVGGAEKLLLDLLKASRHDPVRFVTVVMNQGIHPGMRAKLEAIGYPAYYLERPEGHRHPKYLGRLLEIIQRHEVRIIHAHNGGSKLWSMLCKLARPSLRLVHTIHDTRLVSRMSPWQLLAHRHFIDLNLAISRAVEAECRTAGIWNCRQIYNGIHLSRFAPPATRDETPGRPLEIICVARMDHVKKGQDVLIRALKLCRNGGLAFRCTLVGGVYAYNRKSFDYLRHLADRLQMEDVIRFVTDCDDPVPMLHGADLFVLPSRFEGLGLAVLEAMAAGLPVLASRVDGPAELIEDGVNGILFEPDNEMSLAAKIMQLAAHPETRDRLRVAAMAHVRRFDIRTMKDAYLDAYEDVLAQGRAARLPTAWRLEHGTHV